MNRQQAADRIRKLQALADPARGATAAERKLAAAKAAKLIDKYGRPPSRPRPPRTQPYRPRYTQGSGGNADWTSVIYTTEPMAPANWSFNVKTGAHSANVKVHHHHSRSNWKIEIPVDAILGDDDDG